MSILNLYGSNVPDTNVASACMMALNTGGVETSKQTTTSGTNLFAEILSQGGSTTGASGLPSSATGNGWIYRPGAGTFAAGNWTASITLAGSGSFGSHAAMSLLVFQRPSGGGSTLLGTLTAATSSNSKTTYSFSGSSIASFSTASGDALEFDLWFSDASDINGDTPTVYESNSSTGGVASDMQITTTSFTLSVYAYGSTTIHDNKNYFLMEKHLDFPTVSEGLYKIARIEGVKATGATTSPRQITLVSRVVGTSRSDLESRIDTLYKGLVTPQQHLTMHALDARYFICDCIDAKLELAPIKGSGFPASGVIYGDVTMVFLCQSPFAYASTASSYDTGTNQATSGGGPYTYSFTLNGGGNVFNRPQIRLYQSGTSLAWTSVTLANQTDNQTMVLTSGLPTTNGDYLDFFCDPTVATNGYSVQKNGSGTPIGFTGIFPVLEPVATQFLLTIAAPSSPQVRVVVTYTSRYLA